MLFLPDYSLAQYRLDSHVDDQARSVIWVQHASGLRGNFTQPGRDAPTVTASDYGIFRVRDIGCSPGFSLRPFPSCVGDPLDAEVFSHCAVLPRPPTNCEQPTMSTPSCNALTAAFDKPASTVQIQPGQPRAKSDHHPTIRAQSGLPLIPGSYIMREDREVERAAFHGRATALTTWLVDRRHNEPETHPIRV